jgi:hypothetical protein
MQRTKDLSSLLAAVGAAVILASAGACGNGSAHAANPASNQRQQAETAWRGLIACLRQNGYPSAPDPVFDNQGGVTFPSGSQGDLPASADQAPAACQRQVQRVSSLPRDTSGGAPTAADRRLGLQLARCLRQNGLADWPDPNSDGTWTLPADLQGKSPAFVSAMQQCGRYLPSGRIHGR